MRVDAVNSFLSSMPIQYYSPVSRVSRDVPSEQLPESMPTAKKALPFAYDSYGKAEARPSYKAPPVTMSQEEVTDMVTYIFTQLRLLHFRSKV